MCMHAQEVFFFQIRSIEKPVMFFKNGHKKLSASPRNGNTPIKNNGPSLSDLGITRKSVKENK